MSVTIIIPVYNRKDVVLRTLQSIPSSYPLIIVDNGSTDGSYELCRQWMLNDHRQNVRVEREFNRGAAAARNKGLSLCTTEWVYFFDSDDVFTGLPKSWNDSLDMVCFPVNMIVNGKKKVRDYSPVADPYVHVLNLMLGTHSMLFRTEWLKSIGGWNEKCMIWDDWELGLRSLINRPRLQWITDAAYHQVYVKPDGLTGESFSKRFDEEMKVMSIMFDEIHDMEPGTRRQKAMFALFLRCYIFSGQLQNEGNSAASDEVVEFVYDKFRVNSMSYRLGSLIRWYVGKGGKRAWQFALKLVSLTS
ncbi:MAG: glycosyltransferase family 2 protein [Bacteroidaceae bacterium]|nr:glycosyltransferase family 2 protein [Bacteroidaceae bacterium]